MAECYRSSIESPDFIMGPVSCKTQESVSLRRHRQYYHTIYPRGGNMLIFYLKELCIQREVVRDQELAGGLCWACQQPGPSLQVSDSQNQFPFQERATAQH